MTPELTIGTRKVGPGHPAYLIAELSANHGQNFDQAVRIVRAMAASGADAVKVQTYTADTLTIPCDNEFFRIGGGTLWDGRTLHDLYQEAFMPREWQPKLQAVAAELGLDFFSTPFDASAVDFARSDERARAQGCVVRVGGLAAAPQNRRHTQARHRLHRHGHAGGNRRGRKDLA